jgi:inhibitor of cysteine peptidase
MISLQRLLKGCVVALLLVLAAGCTASDVPLNAKDDGKRVELRPGQILAISLEANPSTGFGWELEKTSQDIVQQLGEPSYKAQSDLVGAPGVQTLRFKVLKAGEVDLKLLYHRSWEAKDPEKTFAFRVVAR